MKVEEGKKRWFGRLENCDSCGVPLKDCSWFADALCVFLTGKTEEGLSAVRKWALVCPACHSLRTHGKFGPGIGQKYGTKTLEKLEG